MTPLPPLPGHSFGNISRNGVGGGGVLVPLPPEIVQRIQQQQQQRGNGTKQPPHPNLPAGSVSFPLFPPGMSEEDIQEFMEDPANQAKIKVDCWDR
jgi:hypothetical protein